MPTQSQPGAEIVLHLAEDLVSAELGPRPEHEIRSALAREVEADRWTRLDAAIRMAADDGGFIDLRPDNPGEGNPEMRCLVLSLVAQALPVVLTYPHSA